MKYKVIASEITICPYDGYEEYYAYYDLDGEISLEPCSYEIYISSPSLKQLEPIGEVEIDGEIFNVFYKSQSNVIVDFDCNDDGTPDFEIVHVDNIRFVYQRSNLDFIYGI